MAATVVRLERCLEEVSHWMYTNYLKLNADKTELLWAARACRYRLTQTLSSVRTRSRARRYFLLRPLSGQTCFQHFCIAFLLTSLTSTITGRWVCEDICSRFCDGSSWLLQQGRPTRQRTEVCDRQTTTRVELHRTSESRQLHAQVQPRTVRDSTRRLALTGSMWQTGSGTSLVQQPKSPQQSTAVSGRLLRSSIRHRQSSATTFCTSLSLSVPRHRLSTLGRRAFLSRQTHCLEPAFRATQRLCNPRTCIKSTIRQSLETFFFGQY